MKVLITGANGQVGKELIKTAPSGIELTAVTREQLDICNAPEVRAFIADIQPDVIINAAAYTAVDAAEDDERAATAVNADAVAILAECAPEHCYLLHISTDFVFDGNTNKPYGTGDTPSPESSYGRGKLLGEELLFSQKPRNSAVIRTSWVYSSHGKNFVNSMLRFMRERDELNIVVDQVGTPTWAKGLAEVCWLACDQKAEGLFHWSDAGVASWYDFAETIQMLGIEHGLLAKPARLNAIPTEEYPLPAKRPAYSVFDKSALLDAIPGLTNKHWLSQLKEMFKEFDVKS